MSSGAINGAVINSLVLNGEAVGGQSGDSQLKIASLEMSSHGTALLVVRMQAGEGLTAQLLGVPEVRMTLSPEGLELATGGTVIARYNTALKPNGLEMAAAGLPTVQSIVHAQSSEAMELGAHQVRQGVDVELGIDSLDMGLQGLHMALAGMQPMDVVVLASGAKPMQLGQPEVRAGSLQATAAEGINALALGAVRVSAVSYAAGAAAVLELGGPAIQATLKARGTDAMALGMPAVVVGIAIPGLDMASSSPAGAGTEGMTVQAAGAEPLELGELQTLGQTGRARQHFPLVLGQPSIVGRWVC